ncbi:MAG: hypothetical protein Q9M10_08180 [Mariprofundaceae bacterium]|nr:hypothetical protein [Mariprofundaceae bacterium]
MMKFFLMLALLIVYGDTAMADPFDAGEGYVNRGAPDMLGYAGLTMLMLNYVLFGLAAVVFGKGLAKKTPWLVHMSRIFEKPWSFGIQKEERDDRHWADIPLTVLLMVLWIFLCQWFNEFGLGAIAMIGLALMAVFVLRMLKD